MQLFDQTPKLRDESPVVLLLLLRLNALLYLLIVPAALPGLLLATAYAQERPKAYMRVVTDPPGADVGVGYALVNGVMVEQPNRIACVETPCTFEILSSDLNDAGSLVLGLRKRGFFDSTIVIGDGSRKVAVGGTYDLIKKLNP